MPIPDYAEFRVMPSEPDRSTAVRREHEHSARRGLGIIP